MPCRTSRSKRGSSSQNAIWRWPTSPRREPCSGRSTTCSGDARPRCLRPPGRRPPGAALPCRGSSAPGASALTAAELRLLPILATHLSFPEIAAEMFLSRNTIKSEANAIYRKLGVSSRSQAIARSRELGLLEG
ncbi:MAG TPA: LuxR C-terminal-related transcriptional regulator [Streptosporangiaceae bacterium]|nr:LuxR C-terminal-related transcriptional regulator [Streptosporangiaceae bacterium]